MKTGLIYIICCLLSVFNSQAQTKLLQAIRPDHGQLQFAGNIGLLSAGVGCNIANNKLQIALMDGFVPASIAGNNINTVALRSCYNIFSAHIAGDIQAVPYTGLTAMFETSGNGYYRTLPERFTDRRYYQFSAFHLGVFAGGKVQLPVGRQKERLLDIYAEAGTIDSYLYYYFRNKELTLPSLFSAALGATYHFGKKQH